jgi:ribosomal protein S14
VGIISEITDDSGSVWRVGIPSDTKWDEKISLKFTEQRPCHLICLHLDSIVPEGFPLIWYFDAKKTSSRVLHEKQQLYLPGVVWYLEAIRKQCANGMPTMVILSEFGEELAGGTRIDIARRLQTYTDERRKGKGKVVVLPGDVGLRVDPVRQSIRCSCCHLEHPWTTPFHCETSGNSEQIFYICPQCLRNLAPQERAERFSNHHASLPGTKS